MRDEEWDNEPEYEAPEVLELGKVEDLTLGKYGIWIDYSGNMMALPP